MNCADTNLTLPAPHAEPLLEADEREAKPAYPESNEAALAPPRAAEAHRLVLIPGALGTRGRRYDVKYEGSVVVTGTLMPLLDGCRALAGLGLSGPVELWDTERPYPRMRSTVQAGALLSVTEGERSAARFIPWRPFDGAVSD